MSSAAPLAFPGQWARGMKEKKKTPEDNTKSVKLTHTNIHTQTQTYIHEQQTAYTHDDVGGFLIAPRSRHANTNIHTHTNMHTRTTNSIHTC